MKLISMLALFLSMAVVGFEVIAQTSGGEGSDLAGSKPRPASGIPSVVGKYVGTFQNKVSRASLMGLAIDIKEQKENGEISGELTQFVGSCRGVGMKMSGNVESNGKAKMKVEGNCPQVLDVQISGNSITGDMYGSNPYEISLKK